MIPLIVLAVIVVAIVTTLWQIFFAVEQQSAGIVERFGKFHKIASPGLNVKVPFIDRVAGRASLRIQQLDVNVETKTADNVFVKVVVSVQFHVLSEHVFKAFYKLQNPEQQITAYVFDVVRSRVPKLKLDDVFEKKDEVAVAVKDELMEIVGGFGYGIIKALVTDINPDEKVKAAMNEINEAQRLRVAATERGEAEKILTVKNAEAEAKSNALQGEGIANQRKAIIDGLRSSIDELKKTAGGIDIQEVMNLVLLTQYFDTLKGIGASSNSNTVLLPHSPGAFHDIANQIRDAVIASNQVGNVSIENPNNA